MRKVIQIQTLAAEVCALCEDGSVWIHDTSAEGAWRALPEIPAAESGSSDKPAQAGKRWSPEDDEQLAQLWCKQGLDASRIADLVQCTEGAIISRLVHLDFFDERDDARAESRRRKTETC